MKTAAFIPVRLSSTRLASKALLKIKGKPCIQYLIERIKRAKKLDLIVLCTTTDSDDDPLIELSDNLNIKYYRGSKIDILERYKNAAIEFKVDNIVNVDGDDIFCEPMLIDKTSEELMSPDIDFIIWKNLPFGTTPLGFKTKGLLKICSIKETIDTQTGWAKFFTDTNMFNVKYLTVKDPQLNDTNIRLTLDYPEDLKLFEVIYDNLKEPFSLKDIVKFLSTHPDYLQINKKMQDQYKQNFAMKETKMKLKKK